jgi:hypothetical protein
MKSLLKLLLAVVALSLTTSVFATGVVGVNPPQSGVLAITNTGIVRNSVAFPTAYQSVPVMKFFSDTTNLTLLINTATNSRVTATNFTLNAISTDTNGSVAWQAYIGTPRIQSGASLNTATLATNVTFPAPYAQVPVVVVTSMHTNAPAGILAVTTTNFTFQCNVASTNRWIAIGITASPSDSASTAAGKNNVNY